MSRGPSPGDSPMPDDPSLCPRCREKLAGVGSGVPTGHCPHCGESPDRPETGRMAATPGGAKTRRPGSSVVTASIAVAAIAGAGVMIYRNVSAMLPEDGLAGTIARAARAPAEPAGPRPEAESKQDEGLGWSRSRLVVVRDGRGADHRPVVILGRPSGATAIGKFSSIQSGLLAREIVRQAVLLAARDELGLSTRDEVLGDAPPSGPGGVSAEVASIVRNQGPASVRVGREG